MSAGTFVEVFQVLASLAVLVWFFSGPWPSCCAAALSRRCLELRDRLLLLASREGADSGDPAVRRALEFLNAGVEAAHLMTFWNVAAALVIARRRNLGEAPDPYAAIREMNEGSLKDGLLEIVRLAVRAHIAHLFWRSPLLFAALLALSPVRRATGRIGASLDRAVVLPQTLAHRDNRMHPPGAASAV